MGTNKLYRNRTVYNSSFQEFHLLDGKNVNQIRQYCTYVTPTKLYSQVLQVHKVHPNPPEKKVVNPLVVKNKGGNKLARESLFKTRTQRTVYNNQVLSGPPVSTANKKVARVQKVVHKSNDISDNNGSTIVLTNRFAPLFRESVTDVTDPAVMNHDTSLPSKIFTAYDRLQELLGELGFTISQSKLISPSTEVTCLGILVNTINCTVSVPPEKLVQIQQLCRTWIHKYQCTKKELQSLLGSLLYISKCVKNSRFFLNRMLALLRANTTSKVITLDSDFKKDLNWFNQFLSTFNGISFFNHKTITAKV